MTAILMAVAGIILIIVGRLPVSFQRTIQGTRARLVGIALVLPVPLIFLVEAVIAFMSGFRGQNFDPQAFDYFIGVIQLPIILLSLLLAFVVTYWPQRRKAPKKADDHLAALYPTQTTETLTLGQVAFQLGLSDSKLRQLIDDGSLTLIKMNGDTLIDRASFDSFVLCQQGVKAASNGQLENALIDFDEAIKLNPHSVRAYFLRGKAYFGLGYYAEAHTDFQYVFDSGQKYSQIDELLIRTRQALKTGGVAKKWTVERESKNSFVNDLAKGPILLTATLLTAAFAVMFAIGPINDLSTYNCQHYSECSAALASATAQIHSTYAVRETGTAAIEIAQGQTAQVDIWTWEAPTIRAEQTLAPILTATRRPLAASATAANLMLTNAANITEPPFSGKVLIVNNGQIYVADKGKLTLFQISGAYPTNDPTLKVFSATWTYRGDRIVVSTTNGVYLVNADGTGATVTYNQSTDTDPALSPDESYFAFREVKTLELSIAKVYDVYSMQNIKHVGHVPYSWWITNLSWSPDGKSLAFCAHAGVDYTMYVVDVNTGTTHRLLDQRYECGLSWSPDGKELVFIAQDDLQTMGQNASSHLAIMDADGGNIRNLFTSYFSSKFHRPSWSPDGKHIAFGYGKPSASMLVIDSDGTNLRNISQNFVLDDPQVSWGP